MFEWLISKGTDKLYENGINSFTEIMLKKKYEDSVKGFLERFNETELDTNAFGKILNKSEYVEEIIEFGLKNNVILTREEFIKSISEKAFQELREYYLGKGRTKIPSLELVSEYYKELIELLNKLKFEKLDLQTQMLYTLLRQDIIDTSSSSEMTKSNNLDKRIKFQQDNTTLNFFGLENLEQFFERAMNTLGKRYIGGANVVTRASSLFEALTFSKQLNEKISEKFNKLLFDLNLLEASLSRLTIDKEYRVNIKDIRSLILKLKDFIGNFNISIRQSYSKENLYTLIDITNEVIKYLDELKYSLEDFNIYISGIEGSVSTIIDIIEKSRFSVQTLQRFINSNHLRLIGKPYLLITGEAGIGKSHLLADEAKELLSTGHIVFLFLGQTFINKSNPLEQMMKIINYPNSYYDFFREINENAKNQGKMAYIFIDALNEGSGKYFWKNYILELVGQVKKYENIALVVSNRINYNMTVFPIEFDFNDTLFKYVHQGFNFLSLKQLEPFFNFYNIDVSIIPLLTPECRNPLFLRFYCEVNNGKKRSDIVWNLSGVIDRYEEIVNQRLSSDDRFKYSGEINLVQRALFRLTQKMYLEDISNIEYINGDRVIQNEVVDIVIKPREYTNALIEENLLGVTESNNNLYLRYSYERFHDIYLAKWIIRYIDYKEWSSLDIFKEENIGVIEAISLILAEEKNLEIVDIEINKIYRPVILLAFIRSLSWRNANKFSVRTLKIITNIIENSEVSSEMLDVLIDLSMHPSHPLNSKFLYDYLKKKNLSELDSIWTIYINQTDKVLEIIESIELKLHNNNEILLYEDVIIYLIPWFLSSTNNILRNKTTILLAQILKQNPQWILPILKKYSFVNDPYILERVYAACYGAVIRTENNDEIRDICDYIYFNIFESKNVFPNILFRDFARGILLAGIYKEKWICNDLKIISPPYKSDWYDKVPSTEEIIELENYYEENFGDKGYSVSSIISSMSTEYGRGIGGYGDFGRYVFQRAVTAWENQFENPQVLSNIAIMRVLELGYNIDTHGVYDRFGGRYYDRHTNIHERIGKKYQWIALYELLAKLVDNFPIYKEEKIYTEEYEKYLKNVENDLEYFIRKIEVDWNEEDDFDNEISEESEDNYLEFNDKYVKKTEKISVPYNGPWESYLRNIDPTLFLKEKVIKKDYIYQPKLPAELDGRWCRTEKELDELEELFNLKYDNQEFVSLAHLYVNLTKDKENENYNARKEFTVKTKACLIKKEDVDQYKQEKRRRAGGNGIQWPSSYNIYAFEHFWHPSYETYEAEVQSYADDDGLKHIDSVHDFIWESNLYFEDGNNSTVSYLMPCKELVSYFNLKQSSEGIWVDKNQNLIAIDLSLLGYESCLLFSKEKLFEFLESNQMQIIWDVYIEKVAEFYIREWWLYYEYVNGKLEYQILDQFEGKTNRN